MIDDQRNVREIQFSLKKRLFLSVSDTAFYIDTIGPLPIKSDWEVKNEEYMLRMKSQASFYDQHYDLISQYLIRHDSPKIFLGSEINKVCRFCCLSEPDVTFQNEAHAISAQLGNKRIFSFYECDVCNAFFGRTIEQDLGNWSMPLRTFARIRGRNGVPTLQKGGGKRDWKIRYKDGRLKVEAYEEDPIVTIDEEEKRGTLTLQRPPFVPVAVLKAFIKMALTIMPDDEFIHFSDLVSWVMEPDHKKPFVEDLTTVHTFQPGPMPNDLISFMILRRKPGKAEVPYAFLIIGYGNDVFQVILPVKDFDAALIAGRVKIPPFPTPGGPDPAKYGMPRSVPLNLTGRELVKGEEIKIGFGFDSVLRVDPSSLAVS